MWDSMGEFEVAKGDHSLHGESFCLQRCCPGRGDIPPGFLQRVSGARDTGVQKPSGKLLQEGGSLLGTFRQFPAPEPAALPSLRHRDL